MSKSKIFLAFCLAFVGGLSFGAGLSVKVMSASAIAALMAVVVYPKKPAVILCCIVFIAIGANSWFKVNSKDPGMAGHFGRPAEISGVVSEEPDERSDKVFLTLSQITIDGKPLPTKLLIVAAKHPAVSYGTVLELRGRITEPADAEAAGEFSYKNYLSRFGISAVVYYPTIIRQGDFAGSKIKRVLFAIKHAFTEKLGRLLPEPENSFLVGILVGERRGIPQTLLDSFNATGTTHLIAISGFNITIIASAVSRAFDRLGRRASFVITIVGIFLFVILTGASASVVRAGIMGALGLLAMNIGRLYAATNAIAFTAVIMIIQNPKILLFDAGFQLSFLALLGLVYLAPILEEKLTLIPKPIGKYLLPTLAAQATTFPLIVHSFERFSVIAPLTNLLVLPLIPVAMGIGFAAGLLALISETLAYPAVWLVWLLARFIILAIELTARIPLASVSIESVPISLIVGYYLILTAGLIVYYHPPLQIWKLKQNN